MDATLSDVRALHRVRPGRVEFVDVPELQYVVLTGRGAPEDPAFAEGAEALAAVSATAHFVARRRTGVTTRIMPLEALWESDADDPRLDLVAALALGVVDVRRTDRHAARWKALIVQPPEIDDAVFEQAVLLARKQDVPRVDEIRLERWREGPVAQLLHVGSYASVGPAVAGLHEAIEAAGHRPVGRQHEIYLRDPRRTPRDALRIVLRRPYEPA